MEDGKEESINNIQFLKTNSGKKGEGMPVVRNPQFYFREGFCWNNVLTTYIKCRIKECTVHSTESMSFFSETERVPDFYIVSIMNAKLIAYFVDSFINSTSHCTTGDAKLIPIIVPTEETLKAFEKLFNTALKIKKETFSETISLDESERQLLEIQENLDTMVNDLYGI